MSSYTLETSDYAYRLTCGCCGKLKKRVWGFICNNGDAHAIYYALLNVEEDRPRVRLTLSVGPWWDGAEPSRRVWVHLEVWSTSDNFQMSICNPEESNFYPWPKGGRALNRDEALQSELIEEIWRLADYIVESDIALASYLNGEAINMAGRQEQDGNSSIHQC